MTADAPSTGAASETGAPPAAHERVVVHDPAAEAIHAIESARTVLSQAVAEVASDDADRVAHGYELAAGCSDHIARALWFLRRAERERQA